MRRTIITFDAPGGIDASGWPFAKTVGDELYFAPESGRLFASPMDEVPTEPCDAQPDELEIALAAHRIEQRTVMTVGRIAHKWAGLRTFAPDRRPVAGFAEDAPGFFWLAGQGGFGLQTSPVMAQVATALLCGACWPLEKVSPSQLGSERFDSGRLISPNIGPPMITALALAALAAAPPQMPPRPVDPPVLVLDPVSKQLLDAHNLERAQVGVPPLQWDPALALAAMSYGPALAASGGLQHSPRASRPGQRENLWRGTAYAFLPVQMVGSWAAERAISDPGFSRR